MTSLCAAASFLAAAGAVSLTHPQAIAAVSALNEGELGRAVSHCRQLEKDGGAGASASFVCALAELRAGRTTRARAAFAALPLGELPEGLAGHARFYAAGTRADEEAVVALAQIPARSRFGPDARSAQVRALFALGEPEAACTLAEDAVAAQRYALGEPAARLQLARCLERLARTRRRDPAAALAARSRARSLYREVAALWPRAWTAGPAREAEAALAERGVPAAPTHVEDLMDRARRVASRGTPRHALVTLRHIARLMPAGETRARHELDVMSGELAYRLRKFRWAARWFKRVYTRAGDSALQARAGLGLARLRARKSYARATRAYDDVAERFPDTREAVVALYHAAELHRRQGDRPEARARLMRCVSRYPDAPPAAQCRWALAWLAWSEGDAEAALVWVDPLLAGAPAPPGDPAGAPGLEPDDEGEAAGEESLALSEDARSEPPQEIADDPLAARRFLERARYWRARFHHAAGRTGAAAKDYTHLARTHPFDWYGLLSRAQLAALGLPLPAPALADAPEAPALHPEVAAAKSYLALGLSHEARATLVPLRRDDLGPDDRRVAAAVWHALGEIPRAHRTAPVPWEGGLFDPAPADLAAARLAYPRAFAEVVESEARDARVPPPLLYALIRAESAFQADARSPARALGLTQVVRRTAFRVARTLKLRGFRFRDLYAPAVAVRVGSTYLGWLLDSFEGHPALALAAYNAGETAAARWLRLAEHRTLDAYVEDIPFSETRRYVRKVISFAAIYAHLYDGEAPVLRLDLPAAPAFGRSLSP